MKSIAVPTTSTFVFAGGICGGNGTKIEKCYNSGNISGIFENTKGYAMATGGITGASRTRKHK